MRGIVLYGAPATGKDTIADALQSISSNYIHYQRAKCGEGRTTGYRMLTRDELDDIRSTPGDVLWETHRYGAVYLIVRSEVLAVVATGTPMVALGQPESVTALVNGVPEVDWLLVELRCPRSVVAERIAARATGDDDERLAIYDATPQLETPHLSLDTSTLPSAKVANQVHREVSK